MDDKVGDLQAKVQSVTDKMLLMTTDFSMSSSVKALASGYKSIFDAEPKSVEFLRDELAANRVPEAEQPDFSLFSYVFQYARWHKWNVQQAEYLGLDDFYFVSLDGDVVYSMSNRGELGLNIKSGALTSTEFGKVASQALALAMGPKTSKVFISDFAPYGPRGIENLVFSQHLPMIFTDPPWAFSLLRFR